MKIQGLVYLYCRAHPSTPCLLTIQSDNVRIIIPNKPSELSANGMWNTIKPLKIFIKMSSPTFCQLVPLICRWRHPPLRNKFSRHIVMGEPHVLCQLWSLQSHTRGELDAPVRKPETFFPHAREQYCVERRRKDGENFEGRQMHKSQTYISWRWRPCSLIDGTLPHNFIITTLVQVFFKALFTNPPSSVRDDW